MRIAPKLKVDNRNTYAGAHWTKTDWLEAINSPDPDWQTAARIIHDRLYGRFLRVIPRIEKMEGAGFAILALDSLLIETLFQFQHGWLQTPFKCASEVFKGFLINQIDGFDEQRAEHFRNHLRNGILHSAETLNDSTIVCKPEEQHIVRINGNGIEINRAKFHPALVKAFDRYIQALRGDTPIDREVLEKLRALAILKMNYICQQPFYYFSNGNRLPNLPMAPEIQGTLTDWDWYTLKKGKKVLKFDRGKTIRSDIYKLSYDNARIGLRYPVRIICANGDAVWAQAYVFSSDFTNETQKWAKEIGNALKQVVVVGHASSVTPMPAT